MFTGIIEELGQIKDLKLINNMFRVEIICNNVLEDVNKGDSIAVNGTCFTVTDFGKDYFKSDIMEETVDRTTFKNIRPGQLVNLERALKLSDRLGGHIVSGHVDGIGNILAIKEQNNAIWFEIKAEDSVMRYIVEKGSVTLDGISLTVAYCSKNTFKVSLIPETIGNTTMKDKKSGDLINIECDIIGKYIEKFILERKLMGSLNNSNNVTFDFLKEHGF